MPSHHQYDVFISYSHNDKDWVRNVLLPELENRHFNVAIDFITFQGGSLGVDEMERVVLQSKRVLLVLTPSYMKSEWSKFENVMAQSIDPSATQRKIVPVLKETCKIPLRLKILHYRDLRANDRDQWDLLFQDLM